MNKENLIPSINFHLWEPCNMRCKFCFATFQDVKRIILPKGHLSKEDAIKVVNKIADFGFKKITFVGGEPTLCPWLYELVLLAKEKALLTNIVTNGYVFARNKALLEKFKNIADWITVSIDSFVEQINIISGRATNKNTLSFSDYYILANNIQDLGIGFKNNTVVHKYNFNEKMSDKIKILQPERWKIFQVLPITGENDKNINNFLISKDEFKHFIKINPNNAIIENNEAMTNSYVMLDPAGRFFNNQNGKYFYSPAILDKDIDLCYNQMEYNYNKFINRKGDYYIKTENIQKFK